MNFVLLNTETKHMSFIRNISFLLFAFSFFYSSAQVIVDAELRPRFEYRHGYKTLFPNNVDPAAYVSQRTRLNIDYKKDNLDFYLSLQDVRVWGDVPQLNVSDNNGIAIHQAWTKIKLDSEFSIKLGRQEIIYDDSRIFGNVGWAQQARSHDVALIQFSKFNSKFDLGFAFNQDQESLTGTTLTNPKTYKAFQYFWYHKDWSNFSTSFLLLNNGLQYIDVSNQKNNETRYSQTLGTHIKFNKNNLKFKGNFYHQFGNDISNNKINASLVGVDLNYKDSNKTSVGLGIEISSGNNNGVPSDGINKAFTPFYGTNHKFNGLMDYFYVGNHKDNVGLKDFYINSNFKLSKKSNVSFVYHDFSAQSNLSGTNKKTLGSEIDIVYANKLQKNIFLKVGYSQLFSKNGMEILKGNSDNNNNNWGWIMLVVKPSLFNNFNK